LIAAWIFVQRADRRLAGLLAAGVALEPHLARNLAHGARPVEPVFGARTAELKLKREISISGGRVLF
jgi:hypothetical protein